MFSTGLVKERRYCNSSNSLEQTCVWEKEYQIQICLLYMSQHTNKMLYLSSKLSWIQLEKWFPYTNLCLGKRIPKPFLFDPLEVRKQAKVTECKTLDFSATAGNWTFLCRENKSKCNQVEVSELEMHLHLIWSGLIYPSLDLMLSLLPTTASHSWSHHHI